MIPTPESIKEFIENDCRILWNPNTSVIKSYAEDPEEVSRYIYHLIRDGWIVSDDIRAIIHYPSIPGTNLIVMITGDEIAKFIYSGPEKNKSRPRRRFAEILENPIVDTD